MKAIPRLFAALLISIVIASCSSNSATQKEPAMTKTDKKTMELRKIDSLLQDRDFAESMAKELEAAYFKGIGATVPPFLQPGEDVLLIDKSVKEEKIATNLAGFYALECGINYLCAKDNTAPADWIEKIITKKTAPDETEIFDRFANATWKASQLFRGAGRIKKENFIGWSGLSEAEVLKDRRQITGAATKLRTLINGTKEEQLNQLRKLLQSREFALEMALFLDSSYYAGEKKPVAAFISKTDDTATKKKSFIEEKIAVSIAGFYALECGLNYFVSQKQLAPSAILQSIINGSISKEDRMLFCRFANATWKAGQPFRSLDRINRDTFAPFNFLPGADTDKDWAQVRVAAEILLKELK